MLHDPDDGLRRSSLRLGAILAGGQSRRFGSPKLLAIVDGVPLVERMASRVSQAGASAVLITGPHLPDMSHILPCRQDLRPGLGPLSGVHTALMWARELGLSGTLCVACDLPLLPSALLRRIAELGEHTSDTVFAPRSTSPIGLEPLCAWYPASAAREVEDQLDSGQLSMSGLLARLEVQTIPLRELTDYGDPATLFLNVNTTADVVRVESLSRGAEEGNGRG